MIDRAKARLMLDEFRNASEMVIMDTEQTCWEGSWERRQAGHPLPSDLREVIQIGAVRVETATFSVLGSFEQLVLPRVNSELSAFCQDFTGITQKRLDGEGIPFQEAFRRFEGFVRHAPVLVYNADADVFRENLAINEISGEVPDYLRIRERLENIGIDMTGVNSGAIARHLGSTKSYREHDALADVVSMADGLAILARDLDRTS